MRQAEPTLLCMLDILGTLLLLRASGAAGTGWFHSTRKTHVSATSYTFVTLRPGVLLCRIEGPQMFIGQHHTHYGSHLDDTVLAPFVNSE